MTSNARRREQQVLVLQGGGALGAYQAGVYEGLEAGGIDPSWIAGISIGGINAALIAGNPPGKRVKALCDFWETASSAVQLPPAFATDSVRSWFNEFSANWIAAFGVPGFFTPRMPPPLLQPPGTLEAISFYDTAPLRQTLEQLVDFDLLNSDSVRLSLGATNVTTGNFCYFDSAHQRLTVDHIMASGALPPGFPPVEIGGQLYWDGGLVSNTPMQYVLDQETKEDLVVFQVDLFSARGQAPRTLLEVAEREKDIRYSSRTRMNTDVGLSIHRAKALLRELIAEASAERRKDPRVQELEALSHENAVTVAHLIFRSNHIDSNSKDYEFSRVAMIEHWAAGVEDVKRTLTHPCWINRKPPEYGVAVFDLGHGGPDTARETAQDFTPAEERATHPTQHVGRARAAE